MIRGLRAITDFEYEIQMSQTNHKLEPEVETMFLTTNLKYSYLSSTIVREVATFGGDISQFVPETVAKSIKKRCHSRSVTRRRVQNYERRIEQIIEEIEEYIDSCKFQPLSTTKIIVNKDQIDELLRELRMKTPDEIKRYQKIIANKDAILADAQQKAESMIEEAHAQTSELVSEHEIMQQRHTHRQTRSLWRQQTRHSRFWIMRLMMPTISVSGQCSIQMIFLPMLKASSVIH